MADEKKIGSGEMMDDNIPTTLDVPEIEAAILEHSLSVGPFGAKNIAEPAMVPTAPAHWLIGQ